jgi:hypothetical protein
MTRSLVSHAEVELRHIKLELDSGRRQHMRHFIDQYYCYRLGGDYVRASGTAHWENIWFKAIRSQDAQKLGDDREALVKEHVVPLKVICEVLVQQNQKHELSLNGISAILEQLTHFAIITKKEDRSLREAGLSSRMPSEPLAEHPFFADLFARYRQVGIEMCEDAFERG